jgi:hypothetical protein
MPKNDMYLPSDFGKKEEKMMAKYELQKEDAKNFFIACVKPRLDRSYKLYTSYNGDRAKEIKKWQANIFVPYVHAVVETLMPRILDARPDFTVQGRTEDDQLKSEKIQNVVGYTWEIAGMDTTSEDLVRSSLVFGNAFLQVSWKKDVRSHKFLSTKDLVKDKYKWNERKQTFYDAPFAEHVDNYCLWYDWHNVARETKQFWFKRRVIPGSVIKRDYPNHDKKRLKLALSSQSGDLTDYASIRNEIKLSHEEINKGSDHGQASAGITNNIYENTEDQDLKMHEVFEWWRPFDDAYAVMVNDVPILKGGFMPNPYDFKEAPFINIPYLKLPNEFEGVGLPIILENPQIMLNMIKNQRIDSATMGIHKMWIVNPMANVDTKELVVRPFGIIYSPDPSGVREVQFSDIKASAYKEEDLLKSDMRYASGVDDFSMGAGAEVGSATAVRHLRESTLERVRLFINHLGEGYSVLMRYWISMQRQFFTKEMTIRIIGEDGNEMFPLIEKDDLMGEFDFIAAVLPAIAGKNDIDKKQGMDLFQLLINLPFVDPQKLTSKVLRSWNWSLESLKKKEEQEMPGAPGMPGAEGLPPEVAAMMGQQEEGAPMMEEGASGPPNIGSGDIPPGVIKQALAMLGERGGEALPAFGEAGMPINLLKAGVMPPTAAGIGKTTNPRGLNMGGAVNTNINMKAPNDGGAQLLNQAANLQK